jgi:hypothetical protein
VSDNDRLVRRPLWYAMASVACFWAGFIVCYSVQPTNWSQQGISHFGNFRASVLPYSAGLLLCALFMALEADALPEGVPSVGVYRGLLRVTAALLAFLLLIPSWKFGAIVGWLHRTVSAGFFLGQIAVGLCLCVMAWQSRLVASLFGVQLMGSFIVLLSAANMTPMLFGSQVVTELAFGLLLIVGTARVVLTVTATMDGEGAALAPVQLPVQASHARAPQP